MKIFNQFQKIPFPNSLSIISFWIGVSTLYILTVILIEFKSVPITDFYSFRTSGLQFLIVSFFTYGLFALLSSNKFLYLLFSPLIFIISGIICYFNLTIGTRLTPVTLELAFINDASMWWSMITGKLILVIILSLIISIFTIYVRFKRVSSKGHTNVILGIVGFLITITPIFFLKRVEGPVGGRLPYSIYFATKQCINNFNEISYIRNTFDSADVKLSTTPPNVIVVIGESLRADHLHMNGYERNTTPILSSDSCLISFPNFHTPYFYTDASLPRLLARSENPDTPFEEQSFISLLKKAGYKSAWFANQDLSRSYTYYAHEADTLYYCNSNRSPYSYESWLDTDILPEFSHWYESFDNSPKLSVIHTIGSHWWYKSHYTPQQAVFKPEISHKDIGGLSRQEMINSYDNTIIATDEFLSELFRIVDKDNSIVIFVSDHGDCLGEDNQYLHGASHPALLNPALLIHYSPEYQQNFPEKIQSLIKAKSDSIQPDNIFYTIVDLSAVSTPVFKREKSILKEL